MLTLDPQAVATELVDAYAQKSVVSVPPSAREIGFDLACAYAVESELVRLRRAAGRTTVGLKVGYANKALWRALKLETLVWAHMYDDTVRFADRGTASLSVAHMYAPKIEPEIVFKMKRHFPEGRGPLPDGDLDAAAVLDAVEWLALGFEIIDCVYADWKFQPSDFVAAFGLHAALVVGEPHPIDPATIPVLVDQLPRFKVQLSKNGRLVEEGSGRNSLRSPALCLGELATALMRQPGPTPASAFARQPGATPLAAGDLVSSGTLTESKPIAPGDTWTATVDGLELAPLALSVNA